MTYTQAEIQQLYDVIRFQPVGAQAQFRAEIRVVREGETSPRFQAPTDTYVFTREAGDEYVFLTKSGHERKFFLSSYEWCIDGDAVKAPLAGKKEFIYIRGVVAPGANDRN